MSNELNPSQKPARKHMIPFAMVECCTLVFCNYNGLIRVGLGCESCLTIINLLNLGISIPSWGAAVFAWVGLWFHCNKDSFVKILLLGGCSKILGREGLSLFLLLSFLLFPFWHGGEALFLSFHPLGYYLCSPLISCLSLYFSTRESFFLCDQESV